MLNQSTIKHQCINRLLLHTYQLIILSQCIKLLTRLFTHKLIHIMKHLITMYQNMQNIMMHLLSMQRTH